VSLLWSFVCTGQGNQEKKLSRNPPDPHTQCTPLRAPQLIRSSDPAPKLSTFQLTTPLLRHLSHPGPSATLRPSGSYSYCTCYTRCAESCKYGINHRHFPVEARATPLEVQPGPAESWQNMASRAHSLPSPLPPSRLSRRWDENPTHGICSSGLFTVLTSLSRSASAPSSHRATAFGPFKGTHSTTASSAVALVSDEDFSLRKTFHIINLVPPPPAEVA
jgi:hypothetical protein